MVQLEARVWSLAITCLLTTAAWADEPLASADAREAPASLVGERVRLFSRPSSVDLTFVDEPLVGKVVAVDAETLTVVKDKRTAETVRVQFSSIKRLDVARLTWRSRAGRGALIGTAIPLAAGFVTLGLEHCNGGDDNLCHLGSALIFAIGTPTGALAGTLIGSRSGVPTDRWERVDTRRVQVSVLPDLRGGIRGRLSVRF